MKKVIALLFLFLSPFLMMAQEGDDEDPSYQMAELNYIKVKVGMEKEFVQAIWAHNEQYHTEAPYKSQLWNIRFGDDAGWFVWTMGTMTYSDLDKAPGEGAHAEDWRKNIAKYIEKYGRNETWILSEKASNMNDIREDLQVVWTVDAEDGEGKEFMKFLKTVAEIHREAGREIQTWSGSFTEEGRDFAMVFPKASYTAFDNDDWDIDELYDAKYGEDAWEDAMDEWEDMVAGMTRGIWTRVSKD